jgi:hypothetical protein
LISFYKDFYIPDRRREKIKPLIYSVFRWVGNKITGGTGGGTVRGTVIFGKVENQLFPFDYERRTADVEEVPLPLDIP